MNKFHKAVLASATALSIGAAGLAFAANPIVGGGEMFAEKNIVENAVNSKDHTTLVAAVKAASLVETLQGKGPFTVFAPTNEAFAALPAGTVENLLKPENKDMLVKILTCHVVGAEAFAKDVRKMVDDDKGKHTVKTLGGCTFTAMYNGDKVMLQDENGMVANITIADVAQSNGVIHVIDRVLLPKM
jgi:uncharacterized surface protein with fasciclin (FAS1) repeats